MKDFFATLGIFTGILLCIAVALYLLSRWHIRIERRLAQKRSEFEPYGPYQTISSADLEDEAAASECGYFQLHDYIRHRQQV